MRIEDRNIYNDRINNLDVRMNNIDVRMNNLKINEDKINNIDNKVNNFDSQLEKNKNDIEINKKAIENTNSNVANNLSNINVLKSSKVDKVVFNKATCMLEFYANNTIAYSITLTDATTSQNVKDYIDTLVKDKVITGVGISEGSVFPEHTSFIKSNLLYSNSKVEWTTTAESSYGQNIVEVSNVNVDDNIYINIGDSNCKDDNVGIIYLYNGDASVNNRVITKNELGSWCELQNRGVVCNKIKIALYSSFATVIPAGTTTTVSNIKIKKGKDTEIINKLEGIKINSNDVIYEDTPKIITVKKDGTGDYTNPVKACNDNWGKNIEVQVYEGEYDIYSSWEDFNKTGSIITGANVGWNTSSKMKIIGIGNREKIILKCELPDDSDSTLVEKASCLNMNFGGTIENLTLTSKNTRYCVHSDNDNYYKNLKYNVKNCTFKHLGNKSGFWQWHGAWMEGSSSGNEYVFENCDFYGVRSAYGTHTNTNFELPSVHTLKNCKFFNNDETVETVSFESLGSGVVNKSYMQGCYVNNSIKLKENTEGVGIDTELMGYGNSRVPVNIIAKDPSVVKYYFTDNPQQ